MCIGVFRPKWPQKRIKGGRKVPKKDSEESQASAKTVRSTSEEDEGIHTQGNSEVEESENESETTKSSHVVSEKLVVSKKPPMPPGKKPLIQGTTSTSTSTSSVKTLGTRMFYEKSKVPIAEKAVPPGPSSTSDTVEPESEEEDIDDVQSEGDDEEDDEDDEDDRDSIIIQPSQNAKKPKLQKAKKPRKDPLTLSDQAEADLVEWIKDNPMLYDKSLTDYRKAAKKREMWTIKAESLGLTYEQIMTWYDSRRTLYGKICGTKSGQAAKPKTQREEWVLKSFSFLEGHIYRQPSRQSCNVS